MMWNRFKYWFGVGTFWVEYPNGSVSLEMSWREAWRLVGKRGGEVYNG